MLRSPLRAYKTGVDTNDRIGAFFATPELKEAMSKAGVNADSVEISYFEEVEAGTLVGV